MAKILQPLTRLEQKVLTWIMANCRPAEGVVKFPSTRKQAAAMGITHQVVHQYRTNLERKGWLTKHRKFGTVTSIEVPTHFEEGFLVTKPLVVGVDPANPGSERCVKVELTKNEHGVTVLGKGIYPVTYTK